MKVDLTEQTATVARASGAARAALGPDTASRRLRVSSQDLEMYAALVGVPQAMLIPENGTAQPQQKTTLTADPEPDELSARRARTTPWHTKAWSATVEATVELTQSITHVTQGLSVRVGRPEFSSWVRRVSRKARREFRQAQARLTTPAGK